MVRCVPTGSRTSRLVSDLVLMGQLLSASVVVGYPGERYPGMALVYGVPRDGGSCTIAYDCRTAATRIVQCVGLILLLLLLLPPPWPPGAHAPRCRHAPFAHGWSICCSAILVLLLLLLLQQVPFYVTYTKL